MRRVEKDVEFPSEGLFYHALMSRYTPSRLLEQLCDDDGCIEVRDVIEVTETINFSVQRHIVRTTDSVKLAMAPLIEPKGRFNSNNSDTTKWKVKRDGLNLGYYEDAIVEHIFKSKIIDHTRRTTVLILGVGSGAIGYWLHAVSPKMNITTVEEKATTVNLLMQWFDVQFGDNNQIVYQKFDTFAEEAMLRGDLYNVIIVNLCPLTPFSHSPCPDTISEQTLQNIRRILKFHALFIMNVLPSNSDLFLENKTIVARFKKNFRNCRLHHLTHMYNKLLICSPTVRW